MQDASFANNAKKIYEEGVEAYSKCDYKTALDKLIKASKNGYFSADLWLGIIYGDGRGIARNTEISKIYYDKVAKNINWFINEAETGEPLAQNNLGYCYQYGTGVSQDYKNAVAYYQMAADQGNATAQNNLGESYYHGHGVAQDYKKAVDYYQMAAGQGNANAQNNLGLCYIYGNGLTKDYYQAGYYFQLVINQRNEVAKENMATLPQQNPEIIDYAKARIACDNKNYAEAIRLCRASLTLVDSKPVWILLAVASMCLAATDDSANAVLADVETIKEYKKEILGEIKKLPCADIHNKDELQNQILLAAFYKHGVAGAIFHAPRWDKWVPNFLGGGKCETDSGTLKDIANELVARGLLMKTVENQDSVVGAAVDSLISYFRSEEIEESAENFHRVL